LLDLLWKFENCFYLENSVFNFILLDGEYDYGIAFAVVIMALLFLSLLCIDFTVLVLGCVLFWEFRVILEL